MLRYFTLEYLREEGWYVGRLKEVPGVFSQGKSLKELEENIRDAYHLMTEEERLKRACANSSRSNLGSNAHNAKTALQHRAISSLPNLMHNIIRNGSR